MALTDIQKQKFFETSGKRYEEGELVSSFGTQRAFNDEKWEDYSPWLFTYIIDPDSGNLICQLEHMITKKQIFGWDRDGKELPREITEKYFNPNK